MGLPLSIPRKSFITFVFFLLPFFQIALPIYIQTTLVNAAPAGQKFHHGAWKDVYVLAVRAGMENRWTLDLPYSTTPDPPVFGFNFFFIVLGHINRIFFHLDPITFLRFSELAMGPLLFIVTFLIIRKLLPYPASIYAFFFVTMVETGFYWRHVLQHPFGLWEAAFEWQHQLVYRHFGLAHHTFSKSLGLIFSFSFLSLYHTISKRLVVIFVLTGFVVSFILPPYIIVFFLTVIFPFAIVAWKERRFKRYLLLVAISAVTCAIPMLFLRLEFSKVPAFAHYTDTEKSWWNNPETFVRYISTFMLYYPFLILSLLAGLKYFRTWSRMIRHLFFVCWSWILFPIPLIFISSHPLFPLANARLVDGYQYLPAGILSGIALWQFTKGLHGKKLIWIIGAVLTVSLLGTIFFSFMQTKFSLANKTIAYTNIYPANETWEAIAFLKTVPRGSGVLSLYYVGEFLPTYTQSRVYSAVSDRTWPHFDDRNQRAMWFFSGTMKPEEVHVFLRENKIDYIFYGEDERRITKTATLYSNELLEVFRNSQVTIYREKK